MEASLAPATHRQYTPAIRKWQAFCAANNIADIHSGRTTDLLHFLTDLFEQGATYGTLNTARSAISLISRRDLSRDARVHRFFKGAFRLRPPRPKYQFTWDVQLVLSLLDSWWPLESIPLDRLTWRLATLLAIASGQRIQTLAAISINNIRSSDQGYEIVFPDILKTTRPGAAQPLMKLPVFPTEPRRCVPTTLRHYLSVTRRHRGQHCQLLLCTTPPYRPASRNSISRWIKRVLETAGIFNYSGQSTRHAATSAAKLKGVD